MSRSRLAVIGGGNMAQAILRGAIDAGVLELQDIVTAEPDPVKRGILEDWGIACVAEAGELVCDAAERCDPGVQILLAIKPQSLADAAAGVSALMREMGGERIVISILAGTPSERIREALGEAARVVRVMPNTPARVGKGMSGLALGAGAREGDESLAVSIFESLGRVERIDEGLMDAFTAVAGSGPAYVFYLAEAMTRAAEELGFEPEAADRVVRATIEGAGALLARDLNRAASELRAAVTSKGGTSEAATRVLDEAKVKESVTRAVRAARDRGRELGG